MEIILKKEPAITIDKVLIIDLKRGNKDIKIELKSAYWMGTHANAVRVFSAWHLNSEAINWHCIALTG